MNNTAKTVTFVLAIVILATVVILGFAVYRNQNQTARTPYTTSVAPKPTEKPLYTNGISEQDTDQAIEGELDATTLEDIGAEFKTLEQETSSL